MTMSAVRWPAITFPPWMSGKRSWRASDWRFASTRIATAYSCLWRVPPGRHARLATSIPVQAADAHDVPDFLGTRVLEVQIQELEFPGFEIVSHNSGGRPIAFVVEWSQTCRVRRPRRQQDVAAPRGGILGQPEPVGSLAATTTAQHLAGLSSGEHGLPAG